MLRTTLLALAAASPLALPLVGGTAALAVDTRDAGQETGQEEHAEEEDPLDGAMMRLKGGSRALRGLMAREDAERCLAVVADMQAAVVQAKSEVPHTVEEQPEEARPAFVADYRRTLLTLLEGLIAVERALLDADFEAAKAAFAEQVQPMEKAGHRRFKDSADG